MPEITIISEVLQSFQYSTQTGNFI